MANTIPSWNEYWKNETVKLSLKKKIIIFVREKIFANEHRKYWEKAFGKDDIILEPGSGPMGANLKVKKKNRTIIALDFSFDALQLSKKNKKVDFRIQADMFRLPFKNESLDGITNDGVMIYFKPDSLHLLLNEFHRALKPNGKMLFFWSSAKLPGSWLVNTVFRLTKKILVPMTVWDPSKKQLKVLLKSHGFRNIKIRISPTLLHYVVIAEK